MNTTNTKLKPSLSNFLLGLAYALAHVGLFNRKSPGLRAYLPTYYMKEGPVDTLQNLVYFATDCDRGPEMRASEWFQACFSDFENMDRAAKVQAFQERFVPCTWSGREDTLEYFSLKPESLDDARRVYGAHHELFDTLAMAIFLTHRYMPYEKSTGIVFIQKDLYS